MKFLIDAQLPVGWSVGAVVLAAMQAAYSDLPDGNRTTDSQIIAMRGTDQRVVVTKDADFVNEHVLHAKPTQLLLVSTGNISNRELEALVVPMIPDIMREFQNQCIS